jgi:competence protein ComGA
MLNRLRECLKIALDYGVTDIHFSVTENNGGRTVIEMRVKDEIRMLKPHEDDDRFFQYLMYRANLDLSHMHEPQTGRFEESVGNARLSLRFAVVSSYHITSGVLRILNNHSALTVNDLTYDPSVRKWLSSVTCHRDGLFIFSGPTGSGKTTSLYTVLNACEGKKIFTLEDPVEVVNESYVQLQINERQHFTYEEGVRQLMRHDPDIIMIGEIRDSSAARMAVSCALTGHLVVTSLHSFSCVSAISRILDLGVQKHQLQDVLRGISNQRLYDVPGCRTGIYEIMDRREVMNYLTQEKTTASFRGLREKIMEATESGIITKAQAEADLA